MKTITISTENSETYSSISNFFIDYYMTDANGEFVKVYLYLVRLLSRGTSFTVAEIADHFNLTENDICRAVKYWVLKEVLRLNYDGKGNPTGIVLLPLKAPSNGFKPESDAISLLKKPVEAVSDNSKEISSPKAELELSVPLKNEVTPATLSELGIRDENWETLIYAVEEIFQKQLSSNELNTIYYIYVDLGFSVDLIEYLLDYCVTIDKKSVRYMEAVAKTWYQEGIKTKAQAKKLYNSAIRLSKEVLKSLGIRRRSATSTEIEFINTWKNDFGFEDSLILRACEKAILQRPATANLVYVNAILENWNKANVKTLEDVEKQEKDYANKAALEAKLKRNGQSTKGGSFNTYEQSNTSSQIDDMEKLLLKEVNN